jgi:hypothetical protein
MLSQKQTAILTISILAGAAIPMVEIVPLGAAVYAQSVENATSSLSSNTVSQSNQTGGTVSALSNLIIDHAGGPFTSLQTDEDNKTWIATGDWDLIFDPSNVNQSNSSMVEFNATIATRGTDNSAKHEHKISEFKLNSSSIDSSEGGSEIVLNGTGSVETNVGLYTDVPLSINITDQAPVIVSLDPQTNEIKPQWIPAGGTIGLLIDESIQDHFGSTPVYGEVRRE